MSQPNSYDVTSPTDYPNYISSYINRMLARCAQQEREAREAGARVHIKIEEAEPRNLFETDSLPTQATPTPAPPPAESTSRIRDHPCVLAAFSRTRSAGSSSVSPTSSPLAPTSFSARGAPSSSTRNASPPSTSSYLRSSITAPAASPSSSASAYPSSRIPRASRSIAVQIWGPLRRRVEPTTERTRAPTEPATEPAAASDADGEAEARRLEMARVHAMLNEIAASCTVTVLPLDPINQAPHTSASSSSIPAPSQNETPNMASSSRTPFHTATNASTTINDADSDGDSDQDSNQDSNQDGGRWLYPPSTSLAHVTPPTHIPHPGFVSSVAGTTLVVRTQVESTHNTPRREEIDVCEGTMGVPDAVGEFLGGGAVEGFDGPFDWDGFLAMGQQNEHKGRGEDESHAVDYNLERAAFIISPAPTEPPMETKPVTPEARIPNLRTAPGSSLASPRSSASQPSLAPVSANTRAAARASSSISTRTRAATRASQRASNRNERTSPYSRPQTSSRRRTASSASSRVCPASSTSGSISSTSLSTSSRTRSSTSASSVASTRASVRSLTRAERSNPYSRPSSVPSASRVSRSSRGSTISSRATCVVPSRGPATRSRTASARSMRLCRDEAGMWIRPGAAMVVRA